MAQVGARRTRRACCPRTSSPCAARPRPATPQQHIPCMKGCTPWGPHRSSALQDLKLPRHVPISPTTLTQPDTHTPTRPPPRPTRVPPQLRAMFFADGDGITLEEVDAICRPLSLIVDCMQLDTGLLIQNLKQVGCPGSCLAGTRRRQACQAGPPRRPPAGAACLPCTVRAVRCGPSGGASRAAAAAHAAAARAAPSWMPATAVSAGPCRRPVHWRGDPNRLRPAPLPPWTPTSCCASCATAPTTPPPSTSKKTTRCDMCLRVDECVNVSMCGWVGGWGVGCAGLLRSHGSVRVLIGGVQLSLPAAGASGAQYLCPCALALSPPCADPQEDPRWHGRGGGQGGRPAAAHHHQPGQQVTTSCPTSCGTKAQSALHWWLPATGWLARRRRSFLSSLGFVALFACACHLSCSCCSLLYLQAQSPP